MQRFFKLRNKRHCTAQSVVELTIFGAIVLFILASIFRQGFAKSTVNEMKLRTFRTAMTESYKTSQRQYTGNRDSSARNTATVISVKDVLSVDAGQKVGTRERIPTAASSSATFTRNMFLPYEEGEEPWSEPVVDYIVNGQRFVFLMGRSVEIKLKESTLEKCGEHPDGGYPGFLPPPLGPACWAENCLKFYNGIEWELQGCPVIYRIADKGDSEFCDAVEDDGCSKNMTSCSRFDLNLDGDCEDPGDVKSGDTFPPDDPGGTPLREIFSWQWVRVPIVPKEHRDDIVLGADDIRCEDEPGAISPEEWTTCGADSDCVEDLPNNCLHYRTIKLGEDYRADVDGDIEREEVIQRFSIDKDPWSDNGHPIVVTIQYDDPHGGHIAFDRGNPSGLKMEESQMFTFTKSEPGEKVEATYYRVEEGRLFDLEGQFIRTTTRQDSVDVIQRKFVLLNNLDHVSGEEGRYCYKEGGEWKIRTWGSSSWAEEHAVKGLENPVEVCVDPEEGGWSWVDGELVPPAVHPCFSSANLYKTCMQVGYPKEPLGSGYYVLPEIYVRSRVRDLRGRRWITKISE